MTFITIVIIAIGLAMDAFAVSVVSGAVYKKLNVTYAFRMAAFFGAFQAFMPLVGGMAASAVRAHITGYDHWIVFGLLNIVGIKMIIESFKIKSEKENFDPSNILVLLVLSVATSIDALAVGITLSFITRSVIVAVVIIGLITFMLSYLGVFIGKKIGHFFESKIEVFGGIILSAIGTKILLEHIFS